MKNVKGTVLNVALISILAYLLILPYAFAGGNNGRHLSEWQVVLSDDFEGDFPSDNGWVRYVDSGDYTWGQTNEKAYSGATSIWCADKALNGVPSRSPGANYANNMGAWVRFGPFDLRNCTEATVSFYMWYLISDQDKIQFLVDLGNNSFNGYSYSGNSNGWNRYEFDLSSGPWGDALWKSDVYIAFKFSSNAAGASTGAFIDSVTVKKFFTGWPDLAFSQFGANVTSVVQGQTFMIEGAVTNTEPNSAQSNQLTMYLSQDNVVDLQTDLILGSIDVPALDQGEIFTFSESVFAPNSVPPGNYYVAAVVDPKDYIQEESNDNNEAVSGSTVQLLPYSGWDAVVNEGFEGEFPPAKWTQTPGNGNYSWDLSSYKMFRGAASIWCNGRNYNNAPNVSPSTGHALNSDAWAIYGPFDLIDCQAADLSFAYWQGINDVSDRLKVLISAGGPWQGFEFNTNSEGWRYMQLDLMAWPGFGSLKQYSNLKFAFNFSTNNTGTDVGTFVDNVVLRRQFIMPDLICSALTPTPLTLQPGNQVAIANKVKNIGTAASTASKIDLYLSTDQTITAGDVLLATNPVDALDVNGEAEFNNSVTLPGDLAEGVYYIGAIVDGDNAVVENSENNNSANAAITVDVPMPDLSCAFVTAQATDAQVIETKVTVTNNGDGAAGATQIKYVLVQDGTETVLGTKDVAALAAGASKDYSETFNLATALTTGTYSVDAMVDPDNTVDEDDEDNNDASQTFDYTSTAVASKAIPKEFALEQNYPNPFNPETTIQYALPKAADVRLTVHNLQGQIICVLVDQTLQAGTHQAVWNGTNQQGDKVASGVYFYQITAGSFKQMNKMILVQ